MLPMSCFLADELEVELRRDWRLSEDGSAVGVNLYHFSNGHCCALVRTKRRKLVGAMSWRWWGAFGRISGVGVSLYVLSKSRWLHVSFDIRGSYAKPTCGPDVSYEENSSLSSLTKADMISLATLDLHRYED